MSDNQWLAIDAATPPTQRARELRSAWEQFLGEGNAEAVRAPIAHSWRRSHAARRIRWPLPGRSFVPASVISPTRRISSSSSAMPRDCSCGSKEIWACGHARPT
jgi:hypothetical protein